MHESPTESLATVDVSFLLATIDPLEVWPSTAAFRTTHASSGASQEKRADSRHSPLH